MNATRGIIMTRPTENQLFANKLERDLRLKRIDNGQVDSASALYQKQKCL